MKQAMKNYPTLAILAMVVGALMISACGGVAARPAGAATPSAAVARNVVPLGGFVAEGRLVPHETANLSFTNGGRLAEVLVKEGDLVKAGQVVARLSNGEQADSAVAAAELEHVNARQALDTLDKTAGVDKAKVERAVADAIQSVRDSTYKLDNFTTPSNQAGLSAFAALEKMGIALDAARKAFDPFKYAPSGDRDREDRKKDLDAAQADYDAAVRRIQLETDQSQAKARLEKARADLAQLNAGPDPVAVAAAQARIKAAEAGLTAARVNHDNLELKAPIDGTIARVNFISGEPVSPNQPVMVVADMSKWTVETDNLTELQVVQVKPGQEIQLRADALPNVELKGIVESIGQSFEEKRGDITYTVKVVVQDPNSDLRWGMTMAAVFGK
jgi:multidrug resistance efflux pump